MNGTQTNLNTLAKELFDAKRVEDEAKKIRIAAEEAIAALIETPENGSKTVDSDGMKIVVKRAMIYKADVDAIAALKLEFSPITLVPATMEFDAKGYEWIRANRPTEFTQISAFVETKPAKVSVTIKS